MPERRWCGFDASMHEAKKIAIAATQRCGSTMVCEDLANAGYGKPNEWFNSWVDEGRDWSSDLDAVYEKGTANGIFAVKIMANQMGVVDARLSSFIAPTFGPPFAHVRTLLDGALWIWNRRRDVVDQAISRYVARQRDVYHLICGQNGFVPGKAKLQGEALEEPTYDFDQIKIEVDAIEAHEAIWSRFFERQGIAPIVMWYEDVIDGSSVQVVADALGVEPSVSGARNLTKLPANDRLKRRFMDDLSTIAVVTDRREESDD